MVVVAGRAPRGWQNLASQPLVCSGGLQTEKTRLHSALQSGPALWRHVPEGKNCILWDTLSRENIPLSSSELSSTKPPDSRITQTLNHGLWTQQLNRSRQISLASTSSADTVFSFFLCASRTHWLITSIDWCQDPARRFLVVESPEVRIGVSRKTFAASGLQLFPEKTQHCKITGVDTAKHAEIQGCSPYHWDSNYPHIQHVSVCLCKPGVHPD